MRFFRGCAVAIVLSVPIWAILIFTAIAIAGCSSRNDGMSDIWKGVKHVQEQRS